MDRDLALAGFVEAERIRKLTFAPPAASLPPW
jgi:hypothetical protein